jgi:hypothetical protein
MKIPTNMTENTDMDGETTQSDSCSTIQDSNQSDHGWVKSIGVPLIAVTGPPKWRTSRDRKGFVFNCGRTPMTAEERGMQITIRITAETYQRIQRLSKRLKCTQAQAVERLIRTEESERIEKTQPIDKSTLIDMRKKYSITNILNNY